MAGMVESISFRAGENLHWDKVLLRHPSLEVIEIDTWEDGSDLTVYHYGSDDPTPFEDLAGRLRDDVVAAWDAYEGALVTA